MKELLKKIRWKWHRDILESVKAEGDIIQECFARQLGDMRVETFQRQMGAIERLQVAPSESAENREEQELHKKKIAVNELIHRLEIEKTFSLLEDRESQKLFGARLYFSLTGSLSMLYKYLMESDRKGDPRDIISLFRSKKNGSSQEMIMFGSTMTAQQTFLALHELGIKVDYVCIEDDVSLFTYGEKSLKSYDWIGTPVITEEELLQKHRDANVFIGDIRCWIAKDYLIKKGMPVNQIWRRHTQWEQQYLDAEIMKPRGHEVYVDGGVLDLQNTLEFIDWCGGEYDAVYAFEPDVDNYHKCLDKVKTNPKLDGERVHLFHAALWSKNEKLNFTSGNAGSSALSNNGSEFVSGMSIDAVLQGKLVTFIKLDIEGAEMKALHGAAQSIRKWKPRLAICIYHRPDDLTEIPLYIHGLVPEYKMYIRHYSTCRAETVLYCVL